MDLIEAKLQQDNVIINEALDEFIQDKKLWFRDLHKEHKPEDIKQVAKDKGENFLKNTALHIGKGSIPIEGELDDEEYKKIVKEKTLKNTT